MHDLDRPFMELEDEAQAEAGYEMEDEHHGEYEAESEAAGNVAGEYEGEYEAEGEGEYEAEGEAYEAAETQWGEVFAETEVNELAAELLGVTNEVELQQFLGSLVKKAFKKIGAAVKSPTLQGLRGVFTNAAKRLLPAAGVALGNLVAPGVGGVIGGKAASAASSLLGLELEGLSHEEGEFEMAKQFVRFAGDASATAASKIAEGQVPRQAVSQSVVQAAQKFAPGLLGKGGMGARPTRARHGRWFRQGDRIVLVGV